MSLMIRSDPGMNTSDVPADTATNTTPTAPVNSDTRPEFQMPCFYIDYPTGTDIMLKWSTNQPYILLALCLVGNGLTFLGSWERCRKSSAHYYMAALAFADSLVIVQSVCLYLAGSFGGNFAPNDAACKAFVALEDFTIYFAVWLLVFMTIDRCNAVTRPLQASRICTVKRGCITTAALCIVCLAYSALTNGFLIKRIINQDGYVNCHVIVPQPWNKVHFWMKLCLSVYTPFVTLLIVNAIILSAISKATKRQAEMTTAQSKRQSSTRKLTIMVVVVCLSFFVLTFPVAIANLLYLEYESMDTATVAYLNDCDGHGPAYLFLYYLGLLFNSYNNVINGFVYLASSTQFRDDIKKFLARCVPSLRRRYEQKTDNSISTVSSNVSFPVK